MAVIPCRCALPLILPSRLRFPTTQRLPCSCHASAADLLPPLSAAPDAPDAVSLSCSCPAQLTSSHRWLGVRIEAIGALTVLGMASIAVRAVGPFVSVPSSRLSALAWCFLEGCMRIVGGGVLPRGDPAPSSSLFLCSIPRSVGCGPRSFPPHFRRIRAPLASSSQVLFHGKLSSGLVGLLITEALSITGSLNWSVSIALCCNVSPILVGCIGVT